MGESRRKPDGAMRRILQEISASHKCMVGSLNNEPRETNQHRFQAFGLRNYFQVAFSSCYLGVRKPEPAIFSLVLGVLGHPPERTLFIDDRQPNVDAAAAMGIRSIHFAGAGCPAPGAGRFESPLARSKFEVASHWVPQVPRPWAPGKHQKLKWGFVSGHDFSRAEEG